MAKFLRKKPRSVRDVLEDLGMSADTIDEAERTGTDELLAIDAVVLPHRTKFTIEEVAAKVGVDADVVREFWRALGFVDSEPGERSFTKRDVRIMRSLVSLAREGLVDREVALQVARVLGVSTAQVAAAVVDASETRSEQRRGGPDEAVPTTDSLAVRASEILPFMSDAIDYAFRRHLRAAARRRVVLAADGAAQVVGFADLVGFTEISQQLDDQELARLVGRFDRVVNRVVVRHGGRVVKMIGDEAMFTVVDPARGALIALELSDAVADDDLLTELRVGMANGTTLARDGDLYGPVVNLASRLVTIGRGGAVNVSQTLRDTIAGDPRFALRSLGQKSLHHIGDVRVYRLRPGPGWAASAARDD